MAWRIDEHVVRGEIDNRTKDRVSGRLWIAGREEPVVLELTGNPWRDLAGYKLKFTNPNPKPGNVSGFSAYQEGVVGDITGSRKVRVPECSADELMEFYAAKQEFPWHWGNSLYLEWFSGTNGRVVIESAHYQLELDGEPGWTMTNEDEATQHAENAGAMMGFMERLGMAAGAAEPEDEIDEDEPRSAAEAAADVEDRKMQRLLDRITARIEREGHNPEDFDRIYRQERERLMRERGEQDPERTPEEEAQRQEWIREMNEIADLAMVDVEAEKWKGENQFEEPHHPLVEQCCDLAVELYHNVQDAGWLAPEAQEEHPLRDIVDGVTCAGAKLAGALGMADDRDDWPPDPLIAGNVLVRLKKARGHLRDALHGMDSADEEGLAIPQWRYHTKLKIIDILAEVQDLIREVRELLEDEGDLEF
ncbi:MAG: hypothetical protein K9N23_21610 [Akkermansiaceae bacterium]|nr:hypothetical protein [Akkermansiaceae bacterium]